MARAKKFYELKGGADTICSACNTRAQSPWEYKVWDGTPDEESLILSNRAHVATVVREACGHDLTRVALEQSLCHHVAKFTRGK